MDTILIYGAAIVLFAMSFFADKKKTLQALKKGLKAVEGIMPQFLTVIILVAVLLAIFTPGTISRLLGRGTGWWGVAVAALIGSITLIPGFVAFPLAGELLRNGAGTLQIATFVSTLMMVGIITIPMEIQYFGKRSALLRNGLAFLFSFAAAFFVAWAVSL